MSLKLYNDENVVLNSLCLRILNTFLPAKASEQYLQGAIAEEFLKPYISNLKNISRQYTELQAPAELNLQDAKSYALYFLPVNFVKVLRVFAHTQLNAEQPLRILDFGAGPGTATLAAQTHFKNISQITLVEKSKAMRQVAAELLPAAVSILSDIKEVKSSFDLILCANSINELAPDLARRTMQLLSEKLNPGGVLILLEPALFEITRRMMSLRDYLKDSLSVIYPCTHCNSCPLLAIEKEWCHTEIDWQRPLLTRQLDKLLSFNKHKIKTSVFVFKKAETIAAGARVVNFPVKRKFGKELWLCSESGLEKKIIDKQDKMIDNYSFLE